jgi:anti-sigma regulatory factor (Ser/Thr protein kinase)
MEHPAYFQVSFRPNVKLVTPVRRFVSEFYQRVLVNQELASRVALATHELVENAVSYASDGETEVRVDVVDERLHIRTWNRATPDQIAAVREAIDEINRAADPGEHYQSLMVKTATRTDGSGLGLARVWAEAEMALSYEIDRERVCILANLPLERSA